MTFTAIKSMFKRIRERREVPETSILDSQRDYIGRTNQNLINCAQIASNEEIEERNRSYFEDGIKGAGKVMDNLIIDNIDMSNGGRWRP